MAIIKKYKKIISVLSLVILSSCGFKLKGQLDNSNLEIKTWKISGIISSELSDDIKKHIIFKKGLVSDNQTQAVLDISENYSESINTLNKGKVNEIRLQYNVTFLVRDANKDKVILVPYTINQFQDIAISDSSTLAKDQEKQKTLKSMRSNATERIMDILQKISIKTIE